MDAARIVVLPFDELWVLRALLLPGEEVGHGGEGGGGHPDVASAGHFHVDDVGARFLPASAMLRDWVTETVR